MWWSMWKEAAPVKRPGAKASAVASPTTTSTLLPSIRSAKEAASPSSSSTAVSCAVLVRRTSVVNPGPGPISMAASPSSTPCSATGRMVSQTSRRQSSLAQYSMWPWFIQTGAWTWYSSFHQRAVRTSSGSVRRSGSWPRSAGVGPMRSATGRSASRSKA